MGKNGTEYNRLHRLTAIQNLLQTKRLVTATALAERFGVSIRTIYRDIRALEQSGVPIVTEDGKGYSLMEGYRLPPVMFTESQANALILAEQFVVKNPDASFVKDYSEAIEKIKAILRQPQKDKANLLAQRSIFSQNLNNERSSNVLSDLQIALTNFNLLKLEYTNEARLYSKKCVWKMKYQTQRKTHPFIASGQFSPAHSTSKAHPSGSWYSNQVRAGFP